MNFEFLNSYFRLVQIVFKYFGGFQLKIFLGILITLCIYRCPRTAFSEKKGTLDFKEKSRQLSIINLIARGVFERLHGLSKSLVQRILADNRRYPYNYIYSSPTSSLK
jgi:hypothetical protein